MKPGKSLYSNVRRIKLEQFLKIADTSELNEGQMMLVETGDEHLVLAKVEGNFYAVSDLCTHARCSLSDGALDGPVLRCPCHGAEFDVRSGDVLAPPADEPLNTYEVKIDNTDILVSQKPRQT